MAARDQQHPRNVLSSAMRARRMVDIWAVIDRVRLDGKRGRGTGGTELHTNLLAYRDADIPVSTRPTINTKSGNNSQKRLVLPVRTLLRR
jgi:hypothetical protein